MRLEAICQTCGRNFLIAQVMGEEQPRCPFCGTRFGRHYVAQMPDAVEAVERSAVGFASAVKKINDSDLGFYVDFRGFIDRLLEEIAEPQQFRSA